MRDRLVRAFRKAARAVRAAPAWFVASRVPRSDQEVSDPVPTDPIVWVEVGDRMPQQVRDDNFRLVADALDHAGLGWWYVTGLTAGRHVVGVRQDDRTQALAALSGDALAAAYVRDPAGPGGPVPAREARASEALASAPVIQVGVPSRARGFSLDLDHGCEIEFWKLGDRILAPRQNRAADQLTPADLEMVDTVVAGRPVRMPGVFSRRMLDDITFDVDVVYTWVDGDDPEWQEARNRALADQSGVPYHSEATYDARFRSRDELRYSLRSIAMYAPWVRKVFLVTSGQTPAWLADSNDRIEVVPHEAIFDSDDLPTFNSNAIISRLHHIPGLGEHYVYFNDDVFLGAPVTPGDFFTPGGLARVFPANNRRPFGPASSDDEPHFNLTRNIRALLEREFGITISRAIWHTPHPQLRSVHLELEERFAAEYRRTWGSRFRHHDDIVADQLHHYYVQITGRGVVGSHRYEYVNLGDDEYLPRLRKLLQTRRYKTFCLNDAPRAGTTPIDDDLVRQWLEDYFPIRCEFEKPIDLSASAG